MRCLHIHNIWCFYIQKNWCFSIVLKPVMTHIILFVFSVFLFTLLTNTLEVDNLHNESQKLTVSRYYCTKMQKSWTSLLSKVPECKISTKTLYIAPSTSTLYQKKYRTDLTGTICSVKVQLSSYFLIRHTLRTKISSTMKRLSHGKTVDLHPNEKNQKFSLWWKFWCPYSIWCKDTIKNQCWQIS